MWRYHGAKEEALAEGLSLSSAVPGLPPRPRRVPRY